jgi:hypothetical protein
MKLRIKVLMVCMVLVLSISNLAISFETASAMPVRSVQGVCDVANTTFPKGCSKTQLDEIKSQQSEINKSAAFEYLDLMEKTVEARCIFWYRSHRESIDRVKNNLSANYHDEQLSSERLISNSKDANDWSGASQSLDTMEKDYMWPGYEDLVQKYLLDQRSSASDTYSKIRDQFRDQFRLDWNARLIERAPIIWSQIKKAAETYNASSSSLAKIVSALEDLAWAEKQKNNEAAAAKQAKKDEAAAAKQQKKAAAERAVQEKKDAAADKAAIEKIKARGGCQIDKSNRRYSWYENGDWYNFPDGTRKCTNRKWGEPSKNSRSNGGSGNNSKNRSLVSKSCDLRAGALSSSWNGQSYSWTIWNNWSDGSKTIASAGSGYANSVPNGC